MIPCTPTPSVRGHITRKVVFFFFKYKSNCGSLFLTDTPTCCPNGNCPLTWILQTNAPLPANQGCAPEKRFPASETPHRHPWSRTAAGLTLPPAHLQPKLRRVLGIFLRVPLLGLLCPRRIKKQTLQIGDLRFLPWKGREPSGQESWFWVRGWPWGTRSRPQFPLL